MRHNNPVLDFNWEKDIREAPEPQRFCVDLPELKVSFEDLPIWRTGFMGNEIYALVQADPLDKLSFNQPIGGEFCHRANKMVLPIIVRSPMLFTRNTVARNFFQQISFELELDYYLWNARGINKQYMDEYWNGLIRRAVLHTKMLETCNDCEAVPENSVGEAIDHIVSLLSAVNLPVNLPKYVKKPEHGLAAFCHPNHENVRYFLDRLKNVGNDAYWEIRKTDRYRGEKDRLFRDVHQRVKTAIHNEYTKSNYRP